MSQPTVTINGIVYDAQTGMPLHKAAQATATPATPRAHHSQHVHQSTQKSATLNRAVVKKAAPVAHKTVEKPRPVVQKSPAITRFAPHPAGAKPMKRSMDIGPASHPMVAKVHHKIQPAAKPTTTTVSHTHKPSQVIKNEAIASALHSAPQHNAKTKQVKQPRKQSRMVSLASASLALVMLAGYFTYLNMPNLSVRVAAAQAGFNATYPGYQPDGYRIKKVAYAEGQVGIQYAANGGTQGFTVKQEKSGWDSSALLANYVEPTSRGGYIPHSEQGITVYVFDNNAAWVNDGIRYTIQGDAPLSSEQILDIATSM
ncbi:MAG: DUF4367 domain-containing protein [Candidatus Saccharimonadales bacterium]